LLANISLIPTSLDAVESLNYAAQYITTCDLAKKFVATYMHQIISILLDQDFVKVRE